MPRVQCARRVAALPPFGEHHACALSGASGASLPPAKVLLVVEQPQLVHQLLLGDAGAGSCSAPVPGVQALWLHACSTTAEQSMLHLPCRAPPATRPAPQSRFGVRSLVGYRPCIQTLQVGRALMPTCRCPAHGPGIAGCNRRRPGCACNNAIHLERKRRGLRFLLHHLLHPRS